MNNTIWHNAKEELPQKEGEYIICKSFGTNSKDDGTYKSYRIASYRTVNGITGFYKFTCSHGWHIDDKVTAWAEFTEYEGGED